MLYDGRHVFIDISQATSIREDPMHVKIAKEGHNAHACHRIMFSRKD